MAGKRARLVMPGRWRAKRVRPAVSGLLPLAGICAQLYAPTYDVRYACLFE